VEVIEISTEGDRILDRTLALVGGKGLFVKAIEDELLAGTIDVAVHSMKDLPAALPAGLMVAATPERADPRDALVGPAGATLATLPRGSRLGTSSLRRAALASRANPGLEIVTIRGNVQTRIAKIESGECDAVLLAAAGLDRLGLSEQIVERVDVERMVPAACQGILALECRTDDLGVRRALSALNHGPTAIAAAAERAFLTRLDGGCQVPMGCYARLRAEDVLTAIGTVVDPSGRPCFMVTRNDLPASADRLGIAVAEMLLRLGAGRILDRLSAVA
jgi:hydroxymethylbilane synthase